MLGIDTSTGGPELDPFFGEAAVESVTDVFGASLKREFCLAGDSAALDLPELAGEVAVLLGCADAA